MHKGCLQCKTKHNDSNRYMPSRKFLKVGSLLPGCFLSSDLIRACSLISHSLPYVLPTCDKREGKAFNTQFKKTLYQHHIIIIIILVANIHWMLSTGQTLC